MAKQEPTFVIARVDCPMCGETFGCGARFTRKNNKIYLKCSHCRVGIYWVDGVCSYISNVRRSALLPETWTRKRVLEYCEITLKNEQPRRDRRLRMYYKKLKRGVPSRTDSTMIYVDCPCCGLEHAAKVRQTSGPKRAPYIVCPLCNTRIMGAFGVCYYLQGLRRSQFKVDTIEDRVFLQWLEDFIQVRKKNWKRFPQQPDGTTCPPTRF